MYVYGFVREEVLEESVEISYEIEQKAVKSLR